MGIEEIIAIAAIVLIVGGAICYLIKAKKSGKKCIGCPYGGNCGKANCPSQKTGQNSQDETDEK